MTPKILREGVESLLTPARPGWDACGRSDPAAAFVSAGMLITHGNIFLVGPWARARAPSGGSSRAGSHFAFVDSDAEIEARTGVDIAYIFEREGEAGFRVREAEVHRPPHAAGAGIVLATGGGAVLDPATARVLAERGRVVYLRTSVDQQLARTRAARNGRC